MRKGLADKFRRAVGGAVLYNDDLVGERLPLQCLQTLSDEVAGVPIGDDDEHSWFGQSHIDAAPVVIFGFESKWSSTTPFWQHRLCRLPLSGFRPGTAR